MGIINSKQGCWFTKDQLNEEERKKAKKIPAFIKKSNGEHYSCFRCGSKINKNWQLPNKNYYCRYCIIFGRLTCDTFLYYFPQMVFPSTNSLKWKGELTLFQEDISKKLINSFLNRQNTLICAVTGAGKTEMIYQTVAKAIDQGGRVCLASPRVDVCIELYKRFCRDFSCDICLLHGNSEPYFLSPLVIATTHQLFKFYKAFDIILVDEVDAFPFVNDEMLYHAVKTSVKEDGMLVYMTATSTDYLDQSIKEGKLQLLTLSRRFHGYPLVVPKLIWLSEFEKNLMNKRLSRPLLRAIKKQLRTSYPLLLFVPSIHLGEKLKKLLKSLFKSVSIDFVASTIEQRYEKVESFRRGNIRILIATTVLERGVTFPKVDVFVLMAHHRLFDASSLIQIAGRIGRSPDRPSGTLLFFHEGKTKAIKTTISKIKKTNQLGGF